MVASFLIIVFSGGLKIQSEVENSELEKTEDISIDNTVDNTVVNTEDYGTPIDNGYDNQGFTQDFSEDIRKMQERINQLEAYRQQSDLSMEEQEELNRLYNQINIAMTMQTQDNNSLEDNGISRGGRR